MPGSDRYVVPATRLAASSIQHPASNPLMPIVLLTYYCALILVASIIGGMIPVWFQLTHRRMQLAVSFVAGVMLGVAVLHMLPHAIADTAAASAAIERQSDPTPAAELTTALSPTPVARSMTALLAGMLTMFFIERFFSFHQHDVPGESHGNEHDHDHGSPCPNENHAIRSTAGHDLSWSGAALGLTLHTVLNGVALAAAVAHGGDGSRLAGFGSFLVIFLHKPFDAMTIGMLMAHGGWSLAWRHTVNALFSLAIPVGVLLFHFGLSAEAADPNAATRQLWIAYALAFSAGTFLCISLSDLLPELQFHQHDRVKLSVALLIGLTVAYAAGRFEAATHGAHSHPSGTKTTVE
jgi:zinc and cadmium transporter